MKERKQEQLLNLLLIVNKIIYSPTIMIIFKIELILFHNQNQLHKITHKIPDKTLELGSKYQMLLRVMQVKTREAIFSLEKLELELTLISNW
jgi:hypothetical protein